LRNLAQEIRSFTLPLNRVIVSSIFGVSGRDLHPERDLIVLQLVCRRARCACRLGILSISTCILKIADRVVHLIF
jgi:hypothetical protein